MAKAPPPDAFQFTLMYSYRTISMIAIIYDKIRVHPRSRDDIGIPSAVGDFDILQSVLLFR